MSKRDKLIKKLKNNPSNVRFEVMRNLLLGEGFEERQPKKGSSHYTYTRESKIITLPKHYPVNKLYVKKVLDLLDE